MVYWASPGFGLALAQAYNDAATAAHARHPDRLVGLAMLPMQAPELALKELERAGKLPGMRGMYLATHVNNIDLDDRRFWDIYAKAEELGWTIFLHPIDTIGRERTTRYYLKNLLGNPYDTGVAAASLIFGGVLDAFPKLEINLPHAGGTFPWLIGRLDRGTKVRPELKHMKQLPSTYLRRFTYDTIGHNDQINANLIRLVGADRVVNTLAAYSLSRLRYPGRNTLSSAVFFVYLFPSTLLFIPMFIVLNSLHMLDWLPALIAVYLTFSAMPDLFTVHAASLDDPGRYKPQMVTYGVRGYAWDRLDPALPIFDKMPPM